MADSKLNQFVASVADATARLAFVPSPPTPASGPASGYFLFQRSDNSSWSWDSAEAAWVPVGGGSTSAPILLSTTVLTNAQVKALPTTPITLIAAPGAGNRLIPIQWDLFGSFAAGAYTNVNGLAYLVSTLGGADYSSYMVNDPKELLTDTTRFFANAGKSHATLVPWNVVSVSSGLIAYSETLSGLYQDAVLALTVSNNGAGDFTGGNVANTLTVRVLYLSVTD